jgi:hypothetical protein
MLFVLKKKKQKHNPNKYGHDNLGGKYLARPKGEGRVVKAWSCYDQKFSFLQ